MIVYVEHDTSGNLMSIVEVHTTEGVDVVPFQPGWSDEEKKEHKAKIAAAIEARENATREELAQRKSERPNLVVLPKNSQRPNHDDHKLDLTTGKIRTMTGPERQAWAQARGQGNQPTP